MTPEELLASANRVARTKVHRAGLLKIIRANEAKEREKTMPEAHTKITFADTTHEAFAAFSDEVEEALPGTHLTFVDKPMFGLPYIMVKINHGDPWDEQTLLVDTRDSLCVGDGRYWVERA